MREVWHIYCVQTFGGGKPLEKGPLERKRRIWKQIKLRWFLGSRLWKAEAGHMNRGKFRQWPTWCTNFLNTFITILYMYMFQAITCSSSGGQIVLIQHLVSSLSVSDCPVHRTVTYWEWRYQILYWYNLTSWGWARYCSKHVHVEDRNKCI